MFLKFRFLKSLVCIVFFSTFIAGCGVGQFDDMSKTTAAAYSPAPATLSSFSGPRSNYFITKTGSGYTVLDVVGNDGEQKIGNVDQMKFADVTLTFNMAEKVSKISTRDSQTLIELYIAFFNRLPDAEGLSYWVEQRRNGMSIEEISNNFYRAAIEFGPITGYSVSMSDKDFINIVYKNVLGRDGADASGLAYWSASLSSGSSTRGTLIKTILDAAHAFKGDSSYGWVANLLDNKLVVANNFAVVGGVTFNTPENSIGKTKYILSFITPTDIDAAMKLVNERASNTRAPVSSNAGVDKKITLGDEVTLVGSATGLTPGVSFTYQWRIANKPVSSKLTISNTTKQTISFTPDVIGEYQLELTSSDGTWTSVPSIVKVEVSEKDVLVNELVIGKPYKARNGLTVKINSFNVRDKGNGYLDYSISYTQSNETSLAIEEGSLKLYFSNDVPMPQFGAFNKVLPGEAYAITRAYTFTQLKSSKVSVLEYDHENFFTQSPVKNSLQWIVPMAPVPVGTIKLFSTDFFGERQLELPYKGSNTFTISSVGTTAAVLGTYTLVAEGRDYTIVNLEAYDSTGIVLPYFSNLANEQVIKVGTSVNFSIMLPLTKGRSVNLTYKFTISETGQTFLVNAVGNTN